MQKGKSALQVWGIQSSPAPFPGCLFAFAYQQIQHTEVEDEDKEVFKAHVEALLADVL